MIFRGGFMSTFSVWWMNFSNNIFLQGVRAQLNFTRAGYSHICIKYLPTIFLLNVKLYVGQVFFGMKLLSIWFSFFFSILDKGGNLMNLKTTISTIYYNLFRSRNKSWQTKELAKCIWTSTLQIIPWPTRPNSGVTTSVLLKVRILKKIFWWSIVFCSTHWPYLSSKSTRNHVIPN